MVRKMDTKKFERTMVFVHRWEGFYANVASDAGKETYRGISRRAHPTWPGWTIVDRVKEHRKLKRNARIPEVDHLIDPFYAKRYWERSGAADLPWPVCLVVMDYAVHSGVKTALSVRAALKATNTATGGRSPRERAYRIVTYRMGFLLRLVKRRPTNKAHIAGWMNRIHALYKEIE